MAAASPAAGNPHTVSAPTPHNVTDGRTTGAMTAMGQGVEATNVQLIRRMLGLAWGYRAAAIKVILLQFILLAMALSGLGLIGLGIDVIGYGFDPVGESNPDGAKPPRWPFGISPPAGWDALQQVMLVAGLIIAIGALRFLFDRWSVVSVAVLVQDIVVDLRGQVYDKLQRLSFRFFDANESGSIINRVTGDVQMVRMFVDKVLIQVLMLLISLVFFAGFMLSLHVTLTLMCLITTPLIWVLTAYFSKVVKPAYRENRRLFDIAVRVLSENVQGVHVVKGFARQRIEQEKFDAANDAVYQQKRWIFWRISTFIPAILLVSDLNLLILLVVGGYVYIHDPTFTFGMLVVFSGLLHNNFRRRSATSRRSPTRSRRR